MLLFRTFLSDIQVFLTSGILLSLQLACLHLFSFLFENGLDQNSSVFELISLGSKIKFVIEGSVDLFGFPILLEQSSKNSLSANPQNFSGCSGLPSTATFTSASVISLTLGLQMQSSSRSRVNYLFALHYEAVLDEFADKNTRISLADLLDLVGI